MKTTNWEDHSEELGRLNAWLDIDPGRTAVVTIDMHRGHLGGEDATMPVKTEVTARVLGAAEKFLRFARDAGMPVIHAVLTWRPEEVNRFNPRVDAGRMTLSHQAPATRALAEGTMHNLVGSGHDLHEAALQNIARCLGWVMSSDEVMAKVQSGH